MKEIHVEIHEIVLEILFVTMENVSVLKVLQQRKELVVCETIYLNIEKAFRLI